MRQGNRPRNSHHGSLDVHCWFSDPFPDGFRCGALREDTVATLCIRRFDIHDRRRNPDQVVRLTPRRSRTTEKSCRRQPRNYPGSIALSLTL
jgi:hypothetical protein